MALQFDLLVIGAGPGGYIAAVDAAKKGMKTAVVESLELGGTCLNRGCIPTKTMLHSSKLYRQLCKAEQFGIEAEVTGFHMDRVQQRKEEILENLRGGIAQLFKKNMITLLPGTAVITGEHTVRVQLDTEEVMIQAEKILIATGSKPAIPAIPGAERRGVLTSDELLNKDVVYQKLVIIGGGVIGMEFASIYSDLGCEVTVIEAMDRILPNMDKEISQNLKMILKKRGVDIHTGAVVQEILDSQNDKLKCRYLEKGATLEAEADAVLIAVGRRPNTEGLFEENVPLACERGCILVNERFQTNFSNIFAIGDVIGGYQLAHTASAQGMNAVAYMNGEAHPPINLQAVPSCVYTDPEIACVGCTEAEAVTNGWKIKTYKYPMSLNGKSALSDQERGFIKVVCDESTGKILGAQMMCARATDMISEFSTAIINGLTAEQMSNVLRPHPTYSEGISEVFFSDK